MPALPAPLSTLRPCVIFLFFLGFSYIAYFSPILFLFSSYFIPIFLLFYSYFPLILFLFFS